MVGRVQVRGRGGCSNLIPVPAFWLLGKTRTHTRSTRVLPVKVETDSGGYPRVRVFLPCLLIPPLTPPATATFPATETSYQQIVEAPPQPSLEELMRQMTMQNMQFQQETRPPFKA